MDVNEKIFALAENFSASAKILTAISDETRQHLIVEMMKMGHCMGVRVGEITERTNLSRPAVSHHLQIMKDAGIVKVRKEGTKNFYYFDSEMEAFERLIETLQLAMKISKELPDRSGDLAIPRNQENFSLQQKRKRHRRRKVCARWRTAAADASIWTCHTQNSFR